MDSYLNIESSGATNENTQNVLTQSIAQYMVAMGTRPLIDTVNLIVEIILEQIEIILDCVNEIAIIRNESKIDLEDFLYFFRKDQIRLKRLFNFLSLTKSVNDHTKLESDDALTDSKETGKHEQSVKKFQKFLNKLDTKGGEEYEKILNNDPELIDHEKLQQLYRLDKQFDHVTTENYIELVNLRRKAYKCISQNKFRYLNSLVWNREKHKAMTSVANECIGFLFRENLSQLIEATLLLKKEQRQRNHYLKLTLQPHQIKDTPKVAALDAHTNQEFFFQAITPNEIMETCRRCLLKRNSTLINKFQRNTNVKSEKNRLLFF